MSVYGSTSNQLVRQLADIVERDLEAGPAQLAQPARQLRVEGDGFEDLEHEALGRHQMDDVVEQQRAVDIDEAAVRPQHRRHADPAERVRDHLRGRLHVVADIGVVMRAGSKQQLVRMERAVAIENRLTAEVDELHGGAWLGVVGG